MALLFLDSFDHYTNHADKYTWIYSEFNTPGPGRHGMGLRSDGAAIHTSTVASSRCILGAAWLVAYSADHFFRMFDYSGEVVGVGNFSDGRVWVAVNGETVSSAVDTIKLNQWYFFELDITLAPPPAAAAPVVKFYVDGLLVIDATDVGPPRAFASAYGWTGAGHGGFGNLSIVDDFYLLDGSGPAPWNAPLGDVQIDVIRPNGVGASTEWTPVGAATNFACCADLTPDDETTKVIAATAGLSDLYQMEDINTNDGIIGAQLLICSRRTEEGFAQLTPLLRHAGTTTPLVTRTISPTYFYRNRDVFVTMPNGDPLTDANVNALQAGLRRTL